MCIQLDSWLGDWQSVWVIDVVMPSERSLLKSVINIYENKVYYIKFILK
jgi:hypothetical protein